MSDETKATHGSSQDGDATVQVLKQAGNVSNDNQVPQAPANDDVAHDIPMAAPMTKTRRRLRTVFNIASVVAGAAATKVGATLLLASFGVPVLGTLVLSSLAVGVAVSSIQHGLENKDRKQRGLAKQAFFGEDARGKNLKNFALSSLFAAIGGALVLGFSEGIFQNLFGVTQAPAAAPVVPVVAPVVVPPTPLEQFATAAAGQDYSAGVADAMARAGSANAAVSAQATKDMAYFAFNGFDGVPKDQVLAVDLFKQAAAAGNVQAKVDLAYIQYHGLAGVTADKAAALSAMKELPTAKAASFVKAWS